MTITAESTSESPTIISVTQKHIDEGVQKSCDSNPVALAIAEATGAPSDAFNDWILWGPSSNIEERGFAFKYSTKTPSAVREFMDRYDEGLPVEPISFELKAA